MRKQLEQFLENYEREILAAACELRPEPLPAITEELFSLFEKDGSRIPYENVYFCRRKFLAVFGMACVLQKKPEDIQKLREVITDICGEMCWALPAHVDRQMDPDGWQNTVDLFASETAFALSEICGLLKEALPDDIRETVREEVLRRVIIPVENTPVPYPGWENIETNWNAVCAGSVGCAALELLKEEPERLERLLDRLISSLSCYIDGFSEDGACMEGLGYFTYGMSFYAAFSEKLEAYTGGDTDLLSGEKCGKIMEFQQKCYFPGGLSVCFSDGSSKERFRVGLTCFLAGKDDKVRFPAMELAAGLHTDSCYRWAALYRDYYFTRKYLDSMPDTLIREAAPSAGQTAPSQDTLIHAQWTICRGANETGLAAKGGHNGEPHNHNDVGSFHYVVGDETFLCDLGAGEYTKDYFQDGTRYTIFVNQSESHNVPIINGCGQKAGEAYACSRFEADGQGGTDIWFEGAYGDPALKKLHRHLAFSPEDGSLAVTDSFRFASPEPLPERKPGQETAGDAESRFPAGNVTDIFAARNTSDAFSTTDARSEFCITENLVTSFPPKVTEQGVLLSGATHRCLLTIPEGSGVRLSAKTYPDHKGKPVTVWLIRWDVFPDRSGCARSSFQISVLL